MAKLWTMTTSKGVVTNFTTPKIKGSKVTARHAVSAMRKQASGKSGSGGSA